LQAQIKDLCLDNCLWQLQAQIKDLCLDIYESNGENGGIIDKFQCRKVEGWNKEISFVEVTEGRHKTLLQVFN